MDMDMDIEKAREGAKDASSPLLSVSEARWVDGSETASKELESPRFIDRDEEEWGSSGNIRYRLSKKPKRVDSLIVEAMDVHTSHKDHKKALSLAQTLNLAFQTLGVVYGDLGTSPLYVFSSVFNQVPIRSETDILGALSLVIYTIAVIPLAKYVFIVLKANDNGEGGTFSLYSLICRYTKISMIPNRQVSDEKISSYKLKLPSRELERSTKVKEVLEKSSSLKTFILFLVLMGTSMVIGDGILTPAMSVMSAVSGLQDQISSFTQNTVLIISIVFLVALFSIQQFGTSKVGLTFAPVLSIWFASLGLMGIYNIITCDITVVKALNPLYIISFAQRNKSKAWMSLGGCVLCITGAEAMFADLGHFSVRSIQIAFTCVVFPCLLLAYMGQAAYIIKNPTMADKAFYASIPDGFFWPIFVIATAAAMIASQAMISATFSCIKQAMALSCFPRLKIIHTSKRSMGQIYIPIANWFLMIMCVLVCATFKSTTQISNAYGIAEVGVMMVTTTLVTLVMLLIWQTPIFYVIGFVIIFGSFELLYFSAVLVKIGEGGWVPLVFSTFFLLIMYTWNYGSVLKYNAEVKQKMSMDLMLKLGSNLGTVRVRGIGLVYSELVHGVPAILGHFLTSLPAIHSTIVFVCIKYVPVPIVPLAERFLFRRICPKDYNMFRCVARYGYKDIHKENHSMFEQFLLQSLQNFIVREVRELALESEPYTIESDDDSRGAASSSDGHADNPLRVPLMAQLKQDTQHTSIMAGLGEHPPQIQSEIASIYEDREVGAVYLVGHGDVRARKDSFFLKKLFINYFYAFMRRNCRASIANLNVPHTNLLQVSMTYMV